MFVYVKLFLVLCLWHSRGCAQLNNVCKNVIDYATKTANPNCWYNSDVDSTTEQIVTNHGYPFESYPITTKDGYKLALHRIPHNNKNKHKKRTPICIVHGLFETSEVWVLVGNRSLAFSLVENGYDVWMANFRGSPHSLDHEFLSVKSPQYWNFSWYEMAIYDLPAKIELIESKTATKGEIILIGHTMGATITFVYSIMYKAEAERSLAGLVSLSPIAYFTEITSPIINVYIPLRGVIMKTLGLLGQYAVFQYRHAQQTLFSLTCDMFPLMRLCETFLFLLVGFDYDQLLPEDIPVLFSMVPTGTSLKILSHYSQEARAGGRFQKYDYGTKKNLQLYGTELPTEFDVKKISLPTHLFYGERDAIATPPAVIKLYNDLQTTKSLTKVSPDGKIRFNHLDYLYAKDIETALYPSLFKVLNNLQST